MKAHTKAVIGCTIRHVGTLFGLAAMIVVAAEAVQGIYFCISSERGD